LRAYFITIRNLNVIKRDIMGKVKAGLYARVSTQKQAKEGYSIATQITQLKEYCQRESYEVVDVFIDEGKSGRKFTNRPELQRLKTACQDGIINAVIVYKLDRLGRSLIETGNLIKFFEDLNVDVMSRQEGSLRGATGRAMRSMILTMAQLESDLISERTKDVMAQKTKDRGAPLNRLPYGYEKVEGSIRVNEGHARTVKQIFEMRKAGMSYNKIARELGYNPMFVMRICKNPKYKGTIRYSKYNEYHERTGHEEYKGDYEAIVSPRTWNLVNGN